MDHDVFAGRGEVASTRIGAKQIDLYSLRIGVVPNEFNLEADIRRLKWGCSGGARLEAGGIKTIAVGGPSLAAPMIVAAS